MTDQIIEPIISTQIAGQFPEYYRDNGPMFVAFLTEYYEWMESNGQALYHARRIPNYKDIDTTVNQFLIYFKNKYLPNIQLETTTNVRLLVKHSLDIYRSRGTAQGIDLLFRLVFGTGATVYQPSSDIFRLSDGRWVEPSYIEVTLMDNHSRFIGKQIIGSVSGAKAFVESYVRRSNAGKIVDVLYLSSLTGDFATGELINTTSNPFNFSGCPKIVGSLSDITVVSSGSGFNVGDIADIYDASNRKRGKARITGTSSTTGQASFMIEAGNYGYTANAQVLISSNVYDVDGIWPPSRKQYFSLFETITQKKATINYVSGTGSFVVGANVYTYYANNTLMGQGMVANSTPANATNGTLLVSVTSGNLQSNIIYTYANAVQANVSVVNGYIDQTSSANVISESTNLTLTVSGQTGSYTVGEEVYQNDITGLRANGTITSILPSGTQLFLSIVREYGTISNTIPLIGRSSGTQSNVVNAVVRVGVVAVNGNFTPQNQYLPVVSSNTSTTSIIRSSSAGSGAGFTVQATGLSYTETVNLNTDLLSSYTGTKLNAVAYNLPANTSANLSSTLYSSLSTTPYTIGMVTALSGISPGSGYNAPPLPRIIEPMVASYNRRDLILSINGASGTFVSGDVVTQASTGARGFAKPGANSSSLHLHRLSLFKEFAATTNTSSIIVGSISGATANVLTVRDDLAKISCDINEVTCGTSAVVDTTSLTANGAVANVAIVDSGFGFTAGDAIVLKTNTAVSASGLAIVAKQGKRQGYYVTKGGFVSDNKKLYDGYYYQEFSYDVRSTLPFEKYSDMLKQVLHVAGTKAFGSVYLTSGANVSTIDVDPVLVATNTTYVFTSTPIPQVAAFGPVGEGFEYFIYQTPGTSNLVKDYTFGFLGSGYN